VSRYALPESASPIILLGVMNGRSGSLMSMTLDSPGASGHYFVADSKAKSKTTVLGTRFLSKWRLRRGAPKKACIGAVRSG
jgi:hypothetical protein